MGIPIVSEIWDGIRWLINSFVDNAPKPLKIILFLFMLVGLVALVPFFLHVTGFHCNTDGEVIQLSPLKVATNVRIGLMDAGELINSSSYIPDPSEHNFIPVFSCRKPVCLVNGTYYWDSSVYCDGQTIIYPYLTTLAEWSRCSVCDGEVNYTQVRGQIADDSFYLCHGDAYHINESDMNWYQSWTCDEGDRCFPPNHYYYEYDTGTYDCIDLNICGENQTIITSKGDDLLEEKGGEKLYETPSSGDYRSFIRLRCDKDVKPEITIYGGLGKDKRGFPIFDYKIWLFIIIIFILFMFLGNIKRH